MSINKGRNLLIAVLIITVLSMILSYVYIFLYKVLQYNTVIISLAFTALSVVVIAMLYYNKKVQELKKLSLIDPVTGLYNYKEFNNRLKQEKARTSRTKIPFSLLLLDIDNFKLLNTKYGYKNADILMKQLLEIISSELRKTDTIFRYRNGDEFSIIAANTEEKGVIKLAERIKTKINKSIFKIDGKNVLLTISVGVSSCYDENSRVEDNSCQALNEAKKIKNVCVIKLHNDNSDLNAKNLYKSYKAIC